MRHPLLCQINTRVYLYERSRTLGRRAHLDDVPDAMLDDLADSGFNWVWFLGVWQTGRAAREVSLRDNRLRDECQNNLPDLRDEDVTGSPFAIRSYEVHQDFGGDQTLVTLRTRLRERNLRLLLDFVPNHVALDHRWLDEHPEHLVQATVNDLQSQPQNYFRWRTAGNDRFFAHGRDPYFDGWPDTVQLNYRHAGLREAQIQELGRIADRCDGVRCDMAMLVQPDVFARTWGERALPVDGSPPCDTPFWPEATAAIRRRHPGFIFVAEVYWGMEWALQQVGFDFTYDKTLYDRLRAGVAQPVREHLWADPAYQNRSVRFLENHDEPRAAATFPWPMHAAAACITYFVPGMRFFHEGQLDGRKVKVSMHVGRRMEESPDDTIVSFYRKLLQALKHPEVHQGDWHLWETYPAWINNPTHAQFIVCSWDGGGNQIILVVNYAPNPGQCYAKVDLPSLAGRTLTLKDLLGPACFQRAGDDLRAGKLYFDMPAWGVHVFRVQDA